ncbi:MAG TPA: rhomboid family intramembrane serine protease [Isosphaeraceae bacterium]|nr:rhomboid family intramembrane serine protease [Isosphaeraceae bacterium]
MSDGDAKLRPAFSWETFILASCAPLGGYPQVHLAPKLPPSRLNLAMRTELPLLENELLLALIDTDAAGLSSEVILTSARLYWSERPPGTKGGAASRQEAQLIRTYGMDYALMPPFIRTARSANGTSGVALGPDRTVWLSGCSPELAEALAGFLQAASQAARGQGAPGPQLFDPGLIERIERALPLVAQVSRKIRTLGRDLHTFRRDLQAATSRTFVTPVLFIACVLMYALMAAAGVNPITPTSQQLLSWGANDGSHVVLRHEFWRLPASVFIHGGLIHLAVNMWCLLSIGPLVERLFGNLAYVILYLAAGLGGAIASMATLPPRVSVGASGAIFGILGALLAFLIVHRRSVPGTVLRPLRSSAVGFVVYSTLFGAAVPNIDQAAHMGGLVTGFLGGFLLNRPWPVVRSRSLSLRQLLAGLLLLGLVLAVGYNAALWRRKTFPAEYQYRDFMQQLTPAILEFGRLWKEGLEQLEAGSSPSGPTPRLDVTLRDLRVRASANLQRLETIQTPAPDLQEARRNLIAGQTGQLTMITAAIQYLETHDRRCLTGSDGVLAGRSVMERSYNEFQMVERQFAANHGLEDVLAGPKP